MSWDTGGYTFDEDISQWDAGQQISATSLSGVLLQLQTHSVSANVALAETSELQVTIEKLLLKLQTKDLSAQGTLLQNQSIETWIDALVSRETDKRTTAQGTLLKLQFAATFAESALTESSLLVRNLVNDSDVTASPLRFHADNSVQANLMTAVKRGDTSHEIGLGFSSTSCEKFRLWFEENVTHALDVAGFFSVETNERAPTTADQSGATYDPMSIATEGSPFEVLVDNFIYMVAVVEPDASLGPKDFAAMYISYDEVA